MGDGDEAARSRWGWTEQGAFEVAPGVHRIPLPLPSDGLRAVNVYAVKDGDGLVLIDSGWALEEAREQLEASLAEIGYGFDDVHRFLVTHVHRDHYTLGVALRRLFGTRISLGIGEQPSLETVLADRHDRHIGLLLRCGADPLVEAVRSSGGRSGPNADDYELPDEWIEGVVDIPLRERTLRAVPTPGHTRGHVVFFDLGASLLFAGDHVLPHITPSVGFEVAKAELPLGDYVASLRLMRRYPDAVLLPAHGAPGGSVHARTAELLQHHEQRLAETTRAVADGAATPFDAAHKLGWTRRRRHLEELDVFNQILAVGETAAHLDLLVSRGVLRRSVVDGVAEYAAAPQTAGESGR